MSLPPDGDWKQRREERERQRRVEWDRIKAEHEALVTSASGLRRAILDLHGPAGRDLSDELECAACPADIEYGGASFPCETYELARDWPLGS